MIANCVPHKLGDRMEIELDHDIGAIHPGRFSQAKSSFDSRSDACIAARSYRFRLALRRLPCYLVDSCRCITFSKSLSEPGADPDMLLRNRSVTALCVLSAFGVYGIT